MNLDRAEVVPGDHDFLIAGSRSGGGLAVALARVQSGEAKIGDTVAVGKGDLSDPQGVDLGDGRWVVAGIGCEAPTDRGCVESAVFTYLVDFKGSAKEIAQIPAQQEGFKLLGRLTDGRVAIELGSNVLPAAEDPPGSLVTYKSRFVTLEAESGSVAPVEWIPPDMSYVGAATSSVNSPAPARPDRQVCAVGAAILLLESGAQADGRVVTLTTIRADGRQATPTPVRISIESDEVPQLLCDPSTSGPLILTASRSTKTVKVRTVDADGRLSAGDGFTWTNEVLAEQHAGGSVAITTGGITMPTGKGSLDGSIPTQPDRQVVVYSDGRWSESPTDLIFGQHATVAVDGKTLLIRRQGSGKTATSFTGVEL